MDSVDPAKLVNAGLFKLSCAETGNLFRYNLGPGDRGFVICPKCGACEPTTGLKAENKHKRLRALSGNMSCNFEHRWPNMSFGHAFQSFCLIVRPTAFCDSVISLAYALRKGLCKALDIETNDIGVSCRAFQMDEKTRGTEIILYDLAPGGAGFVRDAFRDWNEVVKDAKEICVGCQCDAACYDCLKDYSNQSYHEKLSRQAVVWA